MGGDTHHHVGPGVTVFRYATHDIDSVKWSKNHDTDDDGWLAVRFRTDGTFHRAVVGPIPEDMVRDALASPDIPRKRQYEPPRGPVWTGD